LNRWEFIFATVLLLASQNVWGQTSHALDYIVDKSDEGKVLPAFFMDVERRFPVRFYFKSEWIEKFSIRPNHNGQTVRQVLDELFKNSELAYFAIQTNRIVIVKDPQRDAQRLRAIESARTKQVRVDEVRLGNPTDSKVEKIALSGVITDSKTGKPLPQVDVRINDQSITTTDGNGSFALSLFPGKILLSFSLQSFQEKNLDLELLSSSELEVELNEAAIQLDEVVIEGQSIKEVATSRVGETILTMRNVRMAPALLGEVDLVKQIQNLPGVTTVGEAASGFKVRGGSVDQNLVLYDGMPVFNTSHAFGFLTAFNPEAVSDVTFFKGGIPAEYGGRTSSILNIRSRDGDYTKWNGRAGIGMITSNIMVNGPLKKDKTALSISLRSTYSNWLIRSIDTDYANLTSSSVFFYDGTFKLTHRISDRTKLSFTGYSSKDSFSLSRDTTYKWSNFQTSAALNHTFSQTLDVEFTTGVSTYQYKVLNQNPRTASDLSYRITTGLAKGVFNYHPGSYTASFGSELLFYQTNPGTLEPGSSSSNAARLKLDPQHSLETSIFASAEKNLTNTLLINAGLRVPLFTSFGSTTVYRYQDDTHRDVASIRDTIQIGAFKTAKTYIGFEPRISLRWMTSTTASLKLGYNRMYQFLHLITNTAAVTPVDLWQASGYYFKPQHADQISLGYFKDLTKKSINLSIEGFYKSFKNLLDFKDGAQLILNNHLETDLLQGNGRAYGMETSIAKNAGSITGSLNYTYSRSLRTFIGPDLTESINQGKEYPSNFDQPHILNASWKINLTRRHFFTGNFTYRTGRPVTVPISVFEFENTTVAYFSGRNQYRIPDYHRLDLALVIEGNHKRNKIGEGTWIFSIYNVYGRRNPYTVFFKGSYNGVPKPYQLSIVGTIFPSVSFNFKF
jgi:TonB dependent receptor/CarboxypepD_reg-like domain/TonB-dependent Receptor Plug Domain